MSTTATCSSCPCRGKEEETYFDHVKADIAARQAETRAELDAMDAAARVRLEGLRPGAYVRVRLQGVPCELAQHFDPAVPLLLGGIAQGEDKVRLKASRADAVLLTVVFLVLLAMWQWLRCIRTA